MRARGNGVAEIAASLQQDPAGVPEALRGTPVTEGERPLGAGRADLAAAHVPRTPRVILDQTALRAAAAALAAGEIDRSELMRRITR